LKIIAINGSHKNNGNTKILLEEVRKEFNEVNADFEEIDLADLDISYCQAHSREFCREKGCVYKDGVDKVLNKMIRADAIIVGSPVYMGSLSGKLKALIDRTVILRRKDFLLRKKVGAAIVVGAAQGGGQECTLRSIHDFMLVQDMTIVSDGKGSSHFGVVGVAGEAGEIKSDKYALETAKNLARRIIEELK